MKTYDGLAPLIDQYSDREAEGWILLKSRDRLDNAASLADATFIVADDEEERTNCLIRMPTFSRYPRSAPSSRLSAKHRGPASTISPPRASITWSRIVFGIEDRRDLTRVVAPYGEPARG